VFLRLQAADDNGRQCPLGFRKQREAPMDEELLRPRKKAHELGEDLSLLSVEELKERVGALKSEIERLEATIRSKEATKSAAETFFRR